MAESQKTFLIPNRVFLVGEKHIPAAELDKLSDEHVNIFLREPNPKHWPPDIAHLKKYLPRVEQMKWALHEILENHEILLSDSLKRWTRAVWVDFTEKQSFPDVQTEDILDEMAAYIKARIGNHILDRSDH